MTPDGNTLFQRDWRVVADTLDVSGMDVAFTVKKTLKPQPNTCDLRIWNLSPNSRKQLEQMSQPSVGITSTPGTNTKKVPVKIEAGYVGTGRAQIWLGELRAAQTTTDGPDMVTELSTGDGDQAAAARLNVSIGAGTGADIAMTKLLKVLGVGQGNLPKAVNLLKSAGMAQFAVKGFCLKGPAVDQMTDLCRSAGLEWSIQDGQLQVLSLGQPLDGQAIRIAPDAGMIGSPTVDTKGILNVTTLMIPKIKPGVKISMDSQTVKGGYRVISCEYTGDTYGNEWYIKIEADKY